MELGRDIERIIFKKIAEDTELPEDMVRFIDCFIKNGCPLLSVLKAMAEFGDISSREDKESLKYLLRDLPIKWEDE